jgi:hypothetical protein
VEVLECAVVVLAVVVVVVVVLDELATRQY